MLKAYRRGQFWYFRLNVRMGNKCDLSDIDSEIIVDARVYLAGLWSADLLGFSRTTFSRAENGAKN